MAGTGPPAAEIERRRRIVEDGLLGFLRPEACRIPEKLREAMEYSLAAGGKRVRPVVLLSAFARMIVV